ncbi:MAG TPA: PAS domain S-box protein [Candidatus Acidoferrales bacterium]|nr:PAS domain S-box protein [Candidatus Acidoferrales bacterium]
MSYLTNNQHNALGDNGIHGAFFEDHPLPMWIQDIDSLRIIGVNRAAMNKYGYSREEFLEKTIDDIRLSKEMERINTDLRPGIVYPNIQQHRLKSGEMIAVETTSRVLDYDGHSAVFTIIHDLADQKRVEDDLNEEANRDLIEAMPIGYYRCTQNRFVEVNPAFARMLCYSREELLAIDIPEGLYFNPAKLDLQVMDRGFRSKPEICQLRKKDGTEIYINDFSRYVQDPEGEIIYREGMCRQISDHEAKTPLEVNAIVDQLPVAVVVHTDLKLVYMNAAALKLAGARSFGQLQGRSMMEFVHSDFQSVMMDHISNISVGEQKVQISEIGFVRVDGSMTLVQITSNPITYFGRPSIQSTIQDIGERRKIEETLSLQNTALSAIDNAIVITDQRGKVEWVNPAFEKLTGYSPSQAGGAEIGKLVKSGKQDKEFYKDMWDTILSGKTWRGQLVNRRNDGTIYDEGMTITPVLNDEGKITHFVATKEDVSERKYLEDELTQAQKLDMVGRLAGGVAHDYNNVLGVILGYGELIKSKLRDEESIRRQLDAIIAAAKRGSALTKQLLSFARKDVISPKIISINTSIESIKEMLQQIIGENRELALHLENNLWNIRIDPTQLDQILVNLATNARDAIADVGTITIETSNMFVDEAFVREHPEFLPGEYVRVSFSDTGKGIDRDTLKRIFEPFFTTKSEGKGLGLAMVHTIVKQNSSHVEVQSEPGIGTKFDIYFPRSNGEPEKAKEQSPSESPRGDATVLVVEDRPDLLELAKRGLEQYGYKVLTALNPREALSVCREFSGDIDLLLADVVMPGMNGGELSRRIRDMKPGIRTLFMSGYSADVIAPQDAAGKRIAFIQKPFTPQALAKKLQEVLRTI